MIRSKLWMHSIAAAIVVGSLIFWTAGIARGAMADGVDATCRVTAPNGSCGSGCVFEIGHGVAYVLTAAHVVGDAPAVQCEFWRQGHQSQPLAGRVTARSAAADTAIVAVPESEFGGRLPAAIPLAPRDYVVRPGETLVSVGCANGAWSTGWKGHALGYDGQSLRFLPAPASGRSGSAVFDAEARQIVALVRARTPDNAEGIGTPVQLIYRAFDAAAQPMVGAAEGWTGVPAASPPVQCGPNGCPTRPEPWQNHLLPYRYRHDSPGQKGPAAPAPSPWPTLPEIAPAKPAVDLAPVDEKLGKIARVLDDLAKSRESAPAPAPAVDEQARKGLEMVFGQLAATRSETEKGIQEVKTQANKATEAVGGLATVVDKLKDSISEHGTLSQQFHARVDKVKAELDEKLGREATDREVRVAYVKDLIQEKIADGGLVGLAKALGLPIGLVLVVWLVTRDVKHKRETGDPLVVEKLAALVEGRLSNLQERFDALKDRLRGTAASSGEPPKSAS